MYIEVYNYGFYYSAEEVIKGIEILVVGLLCDVLPLSYTVISIKRNYVIGNPPEFSQQQRQKFIYRWKSPATGSNQEYLFNGGSSTCYQKIARRQLRIVIKSPLSKMSLSLTTSSVNSNLCANSWTISIVPDMVALLLAIIWSRKILAVSGLHLILGKRDSYLVCIRILQLSFCLRIVVTKY